MKASLGIAVLALGAAGCVAFPHSVMLQQTAAPLREGTAEVGVGVSGGYTEATASSGGSSSSVGSFGGPRVEGNAAYGLSDIFGLNLHFSPAGLQPGVKITLVHGAVDLSILPSVSFGYLGSQTTTGAGTSSASTSGSEFIFLGGIRAIVSIPMGLYAGAGYDFTYVGGSGNTGGTGATSTTNISATLHTLAFAAGYRAAAGPLRIYIEADPFVSPGGTESASGSTMSANLTDWGLLIGLTLAVNSGGAVVESR